MSYSFEDGLICPSADVCAICGDVYCDGISCLADLVGDDREVDGFNPVDQERVEQLQAWVRLGRIQEQANAFLAHVENRS